MRNVTRTPACRLLASDRVLDEVASSSKFVDVRVRVLVETRDVARGRGPWDGLSVGRCRSTEIKPFSLERGARLPIGPKSLSDEHGEIAMQKRLD